MELKIILWIAVCICVVADTTDYDQFLINEDDIEKGQLIYWYGCASSVAQCNLTCVFFDYPSNETIFVNWTINGEPISETESWNDLGNPQFVSSHLTINMTAHNNYTCISYLSAFPDERISTHTFPITSKQKPPIIGGKDEKNMTYVISGTGECTINLTCLVTANPMPIAILISYNSTHYQFNKMNFSFGHVMDSYIFKSSIQTSNGENSGTKYMCVASNLMGTSASYPIYPYVNPGVPLMSQNKIPLDNTKSTYDLMCNSSGGFPAPNMTWSILTNDFLIENITTVNNYPMDHGTSYTTISINATNVNNSITVRCLVSSKNKNYTTEAKFISSTEPSIVYLKNCSADNFYSDSYCTLECRVYSPYSVSAQWLYMSTPSQPISNSYQLSQTNYLTNNSNYYTASINLSDYRNGYYKCQINSKGNPLQNVFHISERNGSQLGDVCFTNKDCLALNSKCDNFICKCLGDYPVPMTSLTNPSACLPKSSTSTNCTSDYQCNYGKDIPYAYQCISNECNCIGVYEYVSETGNTECITPVSYYGTCYYDEQCRLMDENMYCTGDNSPGSYGYCNCQSGYQYYYSCYSMYGQYLSVSAALGIAFGVVLLICIIFVFIIILSKSHSRRNANRVRTTTNVPSNCTPEFVNITDTSYPMESPPSYGEIRRSETPPPAFEDSFDLKFDNSTASVLYLVNNNYSEDEKVEGATNNAMEHELYEKSEEFANFN